MADDVLPLSRLRAKLAAPRGKRKLDALLSAPDPAHAVAALAVPELHLLVHELGFADALELIELATPEQIQGCLDLDLWDRDQAQLEASLPWLASLVECGPDKLAHVWERLDSELTALILARATKIYDLTLDEEPDDTDGLPIVLTPDNFFAIKMVTLDEHSRHLIQAVIDYLYRADPSGALARHTIMAARSEPPAELEEISYRWRSGRMADLGYVDFYDALEIWKPLEPESVRIGEGTQDRAAQTPHADDEPPLPGLPVPIAERVVGRSFLARALDRITDPAEIARLEMAIVVLVNKVLSAARVSPAEREAAELAAEHAAATVALGLESVSRGDLAEAVRALGSISLTRLHRLGHTLTLRLGRLARALAPRAATAGEPASAVLEALLGARPFYARILDTPSMAGIRPFESLEDIRQVAEVLTTLALRIAIVTGLEVDLLAMAQAPEPRPAMDDHVRTALVRVMLGGPLEPVPLSVDELRAFQTTVLEDGVISAKARLAAAQALFGCLDKAQVDAARQYLPGLLDGWFRDLEETIGPLGENPDPRFIDRVLLAARRH